MFKIASSRRIYFAQFCINEMLLIKTTLNYNVHNFTKVSDFTSIASDGGSSSTILSIVILDCNGFCRLQAHRYAGILQQKTSLALKTSHGNIKFSKDTDIIVSIKNLLKNSTALMKRKTGKWKSYLLKTYWRSNCIWKSYN